VQSAGHFLFLETLAYKIDHLAFTRSQLGDLALRNVGHISEPLDPCGLSIRFCQSSASRRSDVFFDSIEFFSEKVRANQQHIREVITDYIVKSF
jgi:hypothetical protein